jgi:hypothetical protein
VFLFAVVLGSIALDSRLVDPVGKLGNRIVLHGRLQWIMPLYFEGNRSGIKEAGVAHRSGAGKIHAHPGERASTAHLEFACSPVDIGIMFAVACYDSYARATSRTQTGMALLQVNERMLVDSRRACIPMAGVLKFPLLIVAE